MSVSVPIKLGKAAIKFPNVPQAQPDKNRLAFKEQQLNIPLPNSDLQYLKNVHDEGRFQISRSQISTTGTICSITPPNGTTFYYLGGVYHVNQISGTTRIELQNDGTIREQHRFTATVDTSAFKLGLDYDSLIGDGSKAYTLEGSIATTAVIDGTIWGYFANTPVTG